MNKLKILKTLIKLLLAKKSLNTIGLLYMVNLTNNLKALLLIIMIVSFIINTLIPLFKKGLKKIGIIKKKQFKFILVNGKYKLIKEKIKS